MFDSRRITAFYPSLFLLNTFNTFSQRVQRSGDVAILGSWFQVQGNGTLSLQKGQFDVVGKKVKLRGIRHACTLYRGCGVTIDKA